MSGGWKSEMEVTDVAYTLMTHSTAHIHSSETRNNVETPMDTVTDTDIHTVAWTQSQTQIFTPLHGHSHRHR